MPKKKPDRAVAMELEPRKEPVRVRPNPADAYSLDRHMGRCRKLRTWLLTKAGLDGLEGRWCDIPLREIVYAVGRRVGLPSAQPSDSIPSVVVCERLQDHVMDSDDPMAVAIVEIVAELADRECRGLVRQDAQIIAAHRAQHHMRKVERDLRKGRTTIKSENAGLPLNPKEALPVAIARRNELMGA